MRLKLRTTSLPTKDLETSSHSLATLLVPRFEHSHVYEAILAVSTSTTHLTISTRPRGRLAPRLLPRTLDMLSAHIRAHYLNHNIRTAKNCARELPNRRRYLYFDSLSLDIHTWEPWVVRLSFFHFYSRIDGQVWRWVIRSKGLERGALSCAPVCLC